jgi:hypothetical protein
MCFSSIIAAKRLYRKKEPHEDQAHHPFAATLHRSKRSALTRRIVAIDVKIEPPERAVIAAILCLDRHDRLIPLTSTDGSTVRPKIAMLGELPGGALRLIIAEGAVSGILLGARLDD